MNYKSSLAACLALASVSVANAQSSDTVTSDTLTIDQAADQIKGQLPPGSKMITVTSSNASKNDTALARKLMPIYDGDTCSDDGEGIHSMIIAFVSAADITNNHLDLDQTLTAAAEAIKPVEDKLFLVPAPKDNKPADMSDSEWQTRYYLTEFANQFKKDKNATLALVELEIPNSHMHCNVDMKDLPPEMLPKEMQPK